MGHYDDFYDAEEERWRKSPAGKKAAAQQERFEELEDLVKQKYPDLWEYLQLRDELSSARKHRFFP